MWNILDREFDKERALENW